VIKDTLLIVCPHCATTNRVPRPRLTEGPVCGRCASKLFDGCPAELDAPTFEAHCTRGEIPVVVDFWAPWCGPCRVMAPAFAAAAKNLEPRYRFAKVNTEVQPQLAARFGVRSIPTLMVFRQGQEIARQSGAMDLATLTRWLEHIT
jgi:thioredoxin 2